MTINEFDTGLTRNIQSLPASLHSAMVGATFVGLPAVLIVVAVVAGIAALRAAQPRIAIALTANIAGLGLNTIIKHFLHRTRPDTLYVTGMHFKSYSFPSGHAYGGMTVYGLLAYLSYKYLPQPWNNVISGALVGLIVLIGLSRVYLGAHYPTDVIGGWILGGITLLLIIVVIKP